MVDLQNWKYLDLIEFPRNPWIWKTIFGKIPLSNTVIRVLLWLVKLSY